MKVRELVPWRALKNALLVLSNFHISHDMGVPLKRNEHRLEPPQDEFLKFNVDGAIFFDIEKIGIGVIVRDKKGKHSLLPA